MSIRSRITSLIPHTRVTPTKLAARKKEATPEEIDSDVTGRIDQALKQFDDATRQPLEDLQEKVAKACAHARRLSLKPR